MKQGHDPKVMMILAGTAFLFGAGVSVWQYARSSDARNTVASLRTQLKDSAQLNQQLAQSSLDLQVAGDQLKHLEKGVPQLAYVSQLLKDLENTGRQNGIEVTGVRPTTNNAPNQSKDPKKIEKKAYQELNIEVKGRGNYGSVMKFMGALEQFPQIVAVRESDLSPKRDTEKSSSRLDVTVKLRVFLFPQPDEKSGKLASTEPLAGAINGIIG